MRTGIVAHKIFVIHVGQLQRLVEHVDIGNSLLMPCCSNDEDWWVISERHISLGLFTPLVYQWELNQQMLVGE